MAGITKAEFNLTNEDVGRGTTEQVNTCGNIVFTKLPILACSIRQTEGCDDRVSTDRAVTGGRVRHYWTRLGGCSRGWAATRPQRPRGGRGCRRRQRTRVFTRGASSPEGRFPGCRMKATGRRKLPTPAFGRSSFVKEMAAKLLLTSGAKAHLLGKR